MRQDHRFQKKKGLTEDEKRIIPIIALPLIVVVLMAIIVIADRKEEPGAEPTAAIAETMPQVKETAAPARAQGQGDGVEGADEDPASFETDTFQKDSMPELTAVMKQYFDARAMADAEKINELYGFTDVSSEELQAQKTRLLGNAKYISSFNDVTTYVMEGTGQDNWLVYTTVNIKFYGAKTNSPMIMWCFIEKNGEGQYRILDNSKLPSDMLEYVEAANRTKEVCRLSADVNARLREALDGDEDLAGIYGILHEGSKLWESARETEPEVVILDGTGESGGQDIQIDVPDTGGLSEDGAADETAAASVTILPEEAAE